MKRLGDVAVVFALICALPAGAQCQFDNTGLITNTNDPSCRDARFEFTESGTGANEIALGYPPPLPQDAMAGFAGFRTYDALHAQHQALALASDALTARIVGQTLSGRDIWAYVAGDADALTGEGFEESAAMLNGGIHAREWQSPEAVTEVLEQLVEGANDGGMGEYLADTMSVVILPVHNIDGFLQTQRFPTSVSATRQQPRDGRMRRKNLRRSDSPALVDDTLDTSQDQWLGVDLNRNSVHGFGQNGGSSGNGISLVYRGQSPASEPETLALQAAAALGPADRLRFYVDAHSFTRQFFVPSTANFRRNAITNALAQRLSAATLGRYIVTTDPIGAEIGLTSDYFAIEYQIPSWTLEIEPRSGGQEYGGTGVSHSGFVLPESEVPRMRDEVARMQLLGFYRQAGPPSVKAVQVTRASDGAVAYRAEWVPEPAARRRTLNVSTNTVLESGADYRLWVSFNKPMRIGDGNGQAVQYAGQRPAELGVVSLDAGQNSSDAQTTIVGDLTNWLGVSGGAPDGSDTYAFDAFAVNFIAPDVTSAQPFSLSLAVADLSMQQLDADPATPVDWGDGHWTGYENALGEAGDSGGTDCQIAVVVAPPGAQTTAGGTASCRARFIAPPPVITPPTVTPQSSGGGGGALGPLLIVMLACRRPRALSSRA